MTSLQSAKGSSLAQHNPAERQKAFRQLEALKGTELAEHAPALLCGLEDKNASHLLDKPFATATKADTRQSTENVLQVQRDMQRGDSMAMADLLARRPRLLQIHLERFIETEHNPHQQLAAYSMHGRPPSRSLPRRPCRSRCVYKLFVESLLTRLVATGRACSRRP